MGDTLREPHFGDDKPFDAIVSNPPYSVKWIGSDDPTLINDERFAPAGVLAPKSKADFAFVLHALSYLSSKGRAAIVCFPGVFFRGGAEQKIRQYLIDNNYVETVISLAPNLFYGTTIAVNILVLSKHKTDTNTQFIDASSLFKKETNTNILTDAHIEAIMKVFDSKANINHFARSVAYEEIASQQDYNLSVSSYVEAKDDREAINIIKLNSDLKIIEAKIEKLRVKIDAIVMDIESDEGKANKLCLMEKLTDGVKTEWKPLEEVCDFKNGFAFKSNLFRESGLPIIRITNVDGKKIDLSDVKFFDPADYKENTKSYEVKKGDVLIAMSGATTGKIGIYTHENTAYLNQRVGKFLPKEGILNNRYLYHFILSKVEEVYVVAGGGAQPNLSSNALMTKIQIPIPCPENPEKSIQIQTEVVRILDSFAELTSELTAELAAALDARKKQYNYYRDLLLSFPKSEVVAA